jgi:hypothetical protein
MWGKFVPRRLKLMRDCLERYSLFKKYLSEFHHNGVYNESMAEAVQPHPNRAPYHG